MEDIKAVHALQMEKDNALREITRLRTELEEAKERGADNERCACRFEDPQNPVVKLKQECGYHRRLREQRESAINAIRERIVEYEKQQEETGNPSLILDLDTSIFELRFALAQLGGNDAAAD